MRKQVRICFHDVAKNTGSRLSLNVIFAATHRFMLLAARSHARSVCFVKQLCWDLRHLFQPILRIFIRKQWKKHFLCQWQWSRTKSCGCYLSLQYGGNTGWMDGYVKILMWETLYFVLTCFSKNTRLTTSGHHVSHEAMHQRKKTFCYGRRHDWGNIKIWGILSSALRKGKLYLQKFVTELKTLFCISKNLFIKQKTFLCVKGKN